MFGWLTPKSPLTDEQRAWIDRRFNWLIEQFGRARLEGPAITPTDEFFPDRYDGTRAAATTLFSRVCRYMDVDPAQVQLEFYREAAADEVTAAFNPGLPNRYALGTYVEENQRIRIRLEETRLREPLSVVATMAHELGHFHLLGGGRCTPETEDHEPLTDLLTVFFGLGIFCANNVLREVNWQWGQFYGSSSSRQGYLSGAQFAYALSLYARQRGEPKPVWARHLRPDVRAWFKVELKRLEGAGSTVGVGEAIVREPNSRPEMIEAELSPPIAGDANVPETPEPAESSTAPRSSADAFFEFTADGDDPPPEGIVVPLARGSADELFSRGVAYASEGLMEEAVAAYSEALGMKPDDEEIRVYRAGAFLALRRHADAVRDCTRVLESDDDPAALRVRGSAYVRLRQFSAALDDLTRVLNADHRDPQAYLMRGLAHSGLGRYRQAIGDFNKAIRHAPTWGTIYLARSRAYASLGKSRQAQADRFEAIRREPALADENLQAERLGG